MAPLRPSAAATGRSRTPSLARSGSAQTRSTSLGGEPDVRHAVEDGDRRRHRPAGAHGGLHLVGRRPVVGPGQAVGEQRALQRDDRAGRRASASATSGERTVPAGRPGAGRGGLHPVIMEGGAVDRRRSAPARRHGRHMSSSDILERPDVRDADTGSANEVFHYVKKNKIAESAVMGTMVEALCGEVFPVTKSPKPGSPVCPACKEVYEQLLQRRAVPESRPRHRSAGAPAREPEAAAEPSLRASDSELGRPPLAPAPVVPPQRRRPAGLDGGVELGAEQHRHAEEEREQQDADRGGQRAVGQRRGEDVGDVGAQHDAGDEEEDHARRPRPAGAGARAAGSAASRGRSSSAPAAGRRAPAASRRR